MKKYILLFVLALMMLSQTSCKKSLKQQILEYMNSILSQYTHYPQIGQEKQHYCLPACLQMIFKGLKIPGAQDLTQDQIADGLILDFGLGFGYTLDSAVDYLNARIPTGYYYNIYIDSEAFQSRQLLQSVASGNDKNPPIWTWWPFNSYIMGHAALSTGYAHDVLQDGTVVVYGFKVNDPSRNYGPNGLTTEWTLPRVRENLKAPDAPYGKIAHNIFSPLWANYTLSDTLTAFYKTCGTYLGGPIDYRPEGSVFVRIREPNWGCFPKNTQKTIIWESNGLTGSVKLELLGNESVIGTIANNLPIEGQYLWNVGDYIGGSVAGNDGVEYQIQVTHIQSGDYDESNNPFQIASYILIGSPVEGSSFTTGNMMNITWDKFGAMGDNVSISLLNEDKNLVYTIEGKAQNSGSFSWTIPSSVETGSYYIRLQTSRPGGGGYVIADSKLFQVVQIPDPQIVVTTPKGVNKWGLGNTYTIKWTSQGISDANVKIVLRDAATNTVAHTITASTPNNGVYTWTIPATIIPGSYKIRVRTLASDGSLGQYMAVSSIFQILENVLPVSRMDDLLGSWANVGVRYRNSNTGSWVQLSEPAIEIAAGDVDGDGIDDLLGSYPGGTWFLYSTNGRWYEKAAQASAIAAGDMNGDGRVDLLGSWADGVKYLNSINGGWYMLSEPALELAAGDIDGDGVDDLIGVYDGTYIKQSSSGSWLYLDSRALSIAAGDMNGDGRKDLIGSWANDGVYYRNSMTGAWVKIADPAIQVAAGDLDGDGIDDLIGVWADGTKVNYSASDNWVVLASQATVINTGRMRAEGATANLKQFQDKKRSGNQSSSQSKIDELDPSKLILESQKPPKESCIRIVGPGDKDFSFTTKKTNNPRLEEEKAKTLKIH